MFFIISLLKGLFFLNFLFLYGVIIASEHNPNETDEGASQVVISKCCICHQCNDTASTDLGHMISKCLECKQCVHISCLYGMITKSSQPWTACPYCRYQMSREECDKIITLTKGFKDESQQTLKFLQRVLFLRRVQVSRLQRKLRHYHQEKFGNRDLSNQDGITHLIIEKQKECGRRLAAMREVQQLKVKNSEHLREIASLERRFKQLRDAKRRLEADKEKLRASLAILEAEKSSLTSPIK